jgi:hypothetical protein
MGTMRLKIILGSVLVAAVVLAGCGGGGSSSGTTAGETGGAATTGATSKPPSKAEFVTQTGEYCIQVPPTYQSKLKELEKKAGKKLSKAETNRKAALPPLKTTLSSIEELVPPTGDEETVEAIVDALKAGVQALEEEPLSKLSGSKSPFAEFQKLAKEYGLATCSGL